MKHYKITVVRMFLPGEKAGELQMIWELLKIVKQKNCYSNFASEKYEKK